jgi:hypothetical protein
LFLLPTECCFPRDGDGVEASPSGSLASPSSVRLPSVVARGMSSDFKHTMTVLSVREVHGDEDELAETHDDDDDAHS